jgi:hypothetical protein
MSGPMKAIDIKQTDKTPEILLDTDRQLFQIKGKCLPENIRDFSRQVLTSFEQYLSTLPHGANDKNGAFRVHFRLGYFNSASAKFIADILALSGQYTQKGCNIKNYWYFDEDDHDMLEAGEEISQMVSVPMEFIAVVKE